MRTITVRVPDWCNVAPFTDEPVYLFTARDMHAPAALDVYASLVSDQAPELAEAIKLLSQRMREWRRARQ